MLTEKDVATMQADLADIGADIEEPITYKRFTGMTPGDAALGIAESPNYDDTAIQASCRELSMEEIQNSGGFYVFGDMEFKIRASVLTPTYGDRIDYMGAIYRPKSVKRTYLGSTLSYTVRAGKE
ncbi:hypothetical protein H1S01_03335 [Heliobacterium chlorum]|uniref:Uncharacterized protein n=1 Tax=Heliobacterium chlorum TaxID=2698 RepID=A0ABR7SYD1_HELCL|nr:hypothetical protein [Heliobacterium chlorum]MBC9783545.1 hypothetical protein [Heliobacterium chlorum]